MAAYQIVFLFRRLSFFPCLAAVLIGSSNLAAPQDPARNAGKAISSNPAARYEYISGIRHSDNAQAAKLAEVSYKGILFDEAWRWRFRILHAGMLLDGGATEEAASELAKVKMLAVPAAIPRAEADARLASLQGYFQQRRQKWATAGQFYEKALTGLSAVKGDSCWEAELLVQHQAQTLRALRKFTLAQELLQRAAPSTQTCGDKTFATLIPFVQGNCYNDQFRFEDALRSFQKSLSLSEENHSFIVKGTTLGNIALCYHNLGDTDNALKRFDDTDAYFNSLGDKRTAAQTQDWGAHIGHRARTYFLLKRYNDAKRTYERALAIAQKTNDQDYYLQWLTELSAVEMETGDLAAAQKLEAEALKHVTAENPFFAQRAYLNEARLDRLQHKFAEAETALQKLQNFPNSSKDPQIQWQIHTERAQIYLNASQDEKANQEFLVALRTADEVVSSIQQSGYRMTFFLQLRGIYQSYADFLVKHHRPEEALKVSERGHARILAETLNLSASRQSPVDFRSIAKARNVVILSYSIADKASYMWVTTGQKTQIFGLPPDTPQKLERLIANHNTEIKDGQRPIAGDSGGRELYSLLIGRAAHLIPPDSKLIVIPDGVLAGLNFETLIPPGDQPHYWVESVEITVSPSLTLLSRDAASSSAPRSILLVGDAIPTVREKLPQLGHEDLDYISHLYPAQVKSLRSQEATPSNLLKSMAAKHYSSIYVSAHAISFAHSPLDSYIVLSPETRGGEYKVSARDLTGPGWKADLVTLSACQSAGAKNIPGEGLVGLSWAVLGAGARNVVASLWPVEANPTAKLMEKFYSHLQRHEPPADALRSAKLDMLRANALPYQWAAFQIYAR